MGFARAASARTLLRFTTEPSYRLNGQRNHLKINSQQFNRASLGELDMPRQALLRCFALVLCLGGATSAGAQEAVKIGVLTVRSGPAKPIGDDILSGIETATKMHGRVLGRPIELVVEESLFNAQAAVTKATKLVQQNNVAGIVGTSTIETLALLSVADRLG
ncbi:MAG: hypothetical protein E6G96_19480, partial [Alphaproteobacteria bacterium]